MAKDWILLTKETRRHFSDATWVPLRVFNSAKNGFDVTEPHFVEDFFALGSVALPFDQKDLGEKLGWEEIGTMHQARPYIDNDGQYVPSDKFIECGGKLVGVELILDDPHPTIKTRRWIINPDLCIALRLIKEGNDWLRPEEGFEKVIQEHFDEKGNHTAIEIKRTFLLDYLAARKMSLRIAYYRQRVENVVDLKGTEYEDLKECDEPRDNGRFSLRIRLLQEVFGGSFAYMRAWRTDVDEESDAPVMGPETSENTDYETKTGVRKGFTGTRIEGEFWGKDWIHHDGRSLRVRDDAEDGLPDFIIETDGSRATSASLRNEDIGRWLWFKATVMFDLLKRRGYSLDWCTRETAQLLSPSGYDVHFGINASDLVTVYAYDIARLPGWEQRLWYAHNTVPDGQVSSELLASQVRAAPADTVAPEVIFPELLSELETAFHRKYNVPLFSHLLDPAQVSLICRFTASDELSLLRLAKELVRAFSERLNIKGLRTLSKNPKVDELRSNKLLEDIVADKIGKEAAHGMFGPIFGVYELRVADAHPAPTEVADSYALSGLDRSKSFLQQGEQMIGNYCRAIQSIGRALLSD